LDDAVRRNLQELRDQYFFWLVASTVAVAVGVIMEGPEIIKDICEVFDRRFSKKVERWISLVSAIGWPLVAGGVAGEFAVEVLTSKADAFIQSFDSGLLADAQRKTALALDDAESAKALARGFESQIADAQARAAEARAQVASAQQAAAEAQSMAKSAELARAELESRIAPRTIDLADREYIGRTLAKFAYAFLGRRVRIHWQPNDLEAAVLGVEIRDALLRSHIGVQTNSALIIGSTGYGVQITGTGRDRQFIESLYYLLRRDAGTGFSWEVNPKYDGGGVSIEVGAKPPMGLNTLGQMLPVPPEP